ncbi:hypothetical protein LUW75_13455 [Streptomyces sp. MRC013]|uniref:hypothetical protein n=1 Tax=Streptomyces sp. MRC013 TaxID=2898276 RepID=UPI0020269393|nr:hypothetical protein [Streptomyces sp. MRC013]URM90818.1 hypothetical protein LUW75_13455 [Streptomyces sp. MRC013]
MVPPLSTTTVQDHVALAEIELCGELMIAASATEAERLSDDRIDEVLKVAPGVAGPAGTPAGV